MTKFQTRAYGRLHRAIKGGSILKPESCSECGKIPPPSLLHGHHHRGYARWWDVVWLCLQCHRKRDIDTWPRGEKNGISKHPEKSHFRNHNPQRKLTCSQVEEIWKLKSAGVIGRIIAEKFSITQRNLYYILSRHTWKNPAIHQTIAP